MKKYVLLFTILSSVTSCSSKHLVYVQESSFGLNVSVGTEGVSKFSLGYDRDIFAIVPKKTDGQDAMSLLSVNKVVVKSLDDMSISEFVAGGAPAAKLAQDTEAVNKLRNKIYSSGGEK
ncbi:hypothetical protein A5320_02135 [Rheinheimera sp. SA_1]|uniref:hypothetical protein n=1 Tax=Rheinheimera sp. SA_1 TaxID=1827365 RepID=UPI0007FB8E6B|nr:hypothetical protein [Rheinheimera sp. SA_1]OBP16236.1 hypothetical protein A5320_02135 [Rheinheimera sp. SA_1]